MEEFFKKYGVKGEHAFFSHVASDPIFAMRVATDYFEEKFPRITVEEAAVQHPDAPAEEHSAEEEDAS